MIRVRLIHHMFFFLIWRPDGAVLRLGFLCIKSHAGAERCEPCSLYFGMALLVVGRPGQPVGHDTTILPFRENVSPT